MLIQVKAIGLPALSALWGRQADIDVEAGSLIALLSSLSARFGSAVREILLDPEGNVDPEVVVVINDLAVGPQALGEYRLCDGDRITFILMAGGG